MAAILDLTRAAMEPSIIIRWGGLPSVWRWRGTAYELAALHSQWKDRNGTAWYRVESRGGQIFLLSYGSAGWSAALWPAPAESGRKKEEPRQRQGCRGRLIRPGWTQPSA